MVEIWTLYFLCQEVREVVLIRPLKSQLLVVHFLWTHDSPQIYCDSWCVLHPTHISPLGDPVDTHEVHSKFVPNDLPLYNVSIKGVLCLNQNDACLDEIGCPQ